MSEELSCYQIESRVEAVWGVLVVGGGGLAASLLVSGGKEELHLIVDLSDTRSVTY